ncbi:hypothetical protein MXD61_15900 [Frankia sp. AgPm24]|uniref:hypothetical protein n=1 Tax=Frankia sp. AgPm24 TaxID=631128 RepID=UPI00200DF8B3|nr:hypothetical protein [Frankia sp. AgPm24]MCK9923336.1 hypothetical protein [Frankia sp. AgPm24]
MEIFSSSDDPFLRHGDVVTECLLAAAVRADIVVIEPVLNHHDVVIEDRGVHIMFSYGLESLIRRHAVEVDEAVSWLDGSGSAYSAFSPNRISVRPARSTPSRAATCHAATRVSSRSERSRCVAMGDGGR